MPHPRSLARVLQVASLALGASLFVACAPESAPVADPGEAALSAGECTASNVRPHMTFSGIPGEHGFAEDGTPAPVPSWLPPGDLPLRFGQPGCGHTALFDVKNFRTDGYAQIVIDNHVFADGAISGWTPDELKRMKMLLYVWQKASNGKWSFKGNMYASGHQWAAEPGVWYPPVISLFGDALESSQSDYSVIYPLETGAYYRFAVDLRLAAPVDDPTPYVELGFTTYPRFVQLAK